MEAGLFSLLQATEFEGLVIKEWNIVQFAKLSRVLTAIAKEYKNQNVQWEGFSAILGKAESEGMAALSENFLEFLTPFVEHATTILTVSCNCDVKKLESLSYTSGVIALMLVLKTNLEHLNGFFGKIVADVKEQTATMAAST
jgi:hypothetical protein